MKSHSPLNRYFNILTSYRCSSQGIHQFQCFFAFTRPVDSDFKTPQLNFMILTELQHCRNINISKHQQAQLQTAFFAFPVFVCCCVSSRKRPFNPYIPSEHSRTILVSGKLQ